VFFDPLFDGDSIDADSSDTNAENNEKQKVYSLHHRYFSVDPISRVQDYGPARQDSHEKVKTKNRQKFSCVNLVSGFRLFRGMSQDFKIPEQVEEVKRDASEVKGEGVKGEVVKGEEVKLKGEQVQEERVKGEHVKGEQMQGLLQGVSEKPQALNIVIACHSHAPLSEFWGRVKSPKICVALPCCPGFSDMDIPPDFKYRDFEIYSGKNRVKIYYG
jgi:hypothetical protein